MLLILRQRCKPVPLSLLRCIPSRARKPVFPFLRFTLTHLARQKSGPSLGAGLWPNVAGEFKRAGFLDRRCEGITTRASQQKSRWSQNQRLSCLTNSAAFNLLSHSSQQVQAEAKEQPSRHRHHWSWGCRPQEVCYRQLTAGVGPCHP